MVQVPRRGVSGPTLIRLLGRLTDADVSESRPSLSDRLSLWLGWTDAIALSTVLEGKPLVVTANTQVLDGALVREYERMRAALCYAIGDEKAYTANVFVPTRRGVARPSPLEAMMDYAIYRQRYQTLQQAMEAHIAKLRVSLRAALTVQTPARARLAMVDAILERSLSIQERRLFATVPGLLEKHFKRLRQAAQNAENVTGERAAQTSESEATAISEPQNSTAPRTLSASTATAAAAAPTSPIVQAPTRAVPLANTRSMANPRAAQPVTPVVPAWLAIFRNDMRSVLLAELDIRLQPIEGLLAALRDS